MPKWVSSTYSSNTASSRTEHKVLIREGIKYCRDIHMYSVQLKELYYWSRKINIPRFVALPLPHLPILFRAFLFSLKQITSQMSNPRWIVQQCLLESRKLPGPCEYFPPTHPKFSFNIYYLSSMVPPRYIWPSYASQMLRLINFLGIVLECLVDEPSSGKQIYPPWKSAYLWKYWIILS